MSTSRHILITGASHGLGLALSKHYLEMGDRVIGCSRGESDLQNDNYTHVCLDIADETAVSAMFRDIRTRFGKLDVLINNAGIASMNPIALTPIATARRIFETNFLGTFACTQAAIRLLRSSPAGRIVNLTTVAVPLDLEGEAVYAASKAAIESFTRITAREVGNLGITCNAVGPSPVKTHLTQTIPEPKITQLIARQAIARWGEFPDVFNVVDFFLKPESSMITGQIIYLGGIN